MKKSVVLPLLIGFFLPAVSFAQDSTTTPERYTAHNKHKFFIFWGGNRDSYTKSDIHFQGDNYDFTLENAEAHDKPKGWHVDYINPGRMTIPQTNFRLGYYITDHYYISAGVDHMKYVMTQYQTVNINGNINLPQDDPAAVFNGNYNNTPTVMTEDFMTFEHTDGLNYINAEFGRTDDLSKYLFIENTDIFQVNISEGIGAGVLYPKTNAKVLEKDRHDNFHVSGYGVSAKAGLDLVFFKHYFIHGELKGGYIDMQDIRTTYSGNDKASQHFMFFETVIAIGGTFRL